MIKYIPLLFALGAQAEDIPFKRIDTGPTYISKSTESVLGQLIIFKVGWTGRGEQRILANCDDYRYALPDISPELMTAEPESEMFNLINEACGDRQWI